MRAIKSLVVFALAIGVMGCGSMPLSRYSNASKYFPPMDKSKGRVYFYRKSPLAGFLKPDIKLNGVIVGEGIAGQYFYKDVAPGQYKVETSTEVSNEVSFKLDKAQEVFVKIHMYFGIIVGRAEPVLVNRGEALEDLEKLNYVGTDFEKIERKLAAEEEQKEAKAKSK